MASIQRVDILLRCGPARCEAGNAVLLVDLAPGVEGNLLLQGTDGLVLHDEEL